MKRYTNIIMKYRKTVIAVFVICTAISVFLSGKVGVNYKFADYLPDDAPSTKSLDVMESEYTQAVPNMRVMIRDVSVAKALSYKEKIEQVDGVEAVEWLDDAVDIEQPMEVLDQDTVQEWYKDENALFQVTVDESKGLGAVQGIRKVIGDKNYMEGEAVTDALAPVQTSKEIAKIMLYAVPLIFVILLITTTSWYEPVLFLVTLGMAILINRGTNLMFGTISFVTNAAGSILQLAVSMDYAVFLLHRFGENREKGEDVESAMKHAVRQSAGSILSSGLTTVTGFAALIFMRFKIGPDMGWVMAKAIVISLASVLALLPALATNTYKLIDKTHHKPLIPPLDRFSKKVQSLGKVAAILFLILVIPCFLMQGKNTFVFGSAKIYSTNKTQMGRDIQAIEKEYGTSNVVAVLVPKEDVKKEKELSQKFHQMPKVTSVISYVDTVGESIPTEFVPKEQAAKLYSSKYSRFILHLDTEEGEADWEQTVGSVRKAAESYYGKDVEYAGSLVSTEDLKSTITQDNEKVTAMAVVFVFVILLVNFKSASIPVLLTLVIEAAFWINMSIPYLTGRPQYYIAYLIVSSVQLGATIDYGILFTDRYCENRKTMRQTEAARKVIQTGTVSVMTSGLILTFVGLILGNFSSNQVLSQLGILIGRGAAISMVLVILVLPQLLITCDKFIQKTSLDKQFVKE